MQQQPGTSSLHLIGKWEWLNSNHYVDVPLKGQSCYVPAQSQLSREWPS